MLSITVDVPIAQVLGAAQDIEEARKAGLLRVATHVQNIAERQVARIYVRSIPRSKSGRPMWERSGDLARAVAAAPKWENSAVVLTADLPYAARRHGLGVDWMPKRPALGIIRKNPFFAEAADITEPQIEALFADGFNYVWEAN